MWLAFSLIIWHHDALDVWMPGDICLWFTLWRWFIIFATLFSKALFWSFQLAGMSILFLLRIEKREIGFFPWLCMHLLLALNLQIQIMRNLHPLEICGYTLKVWPIQPCELSSVLSALHDIFEDIIYMVLWFYVIAWKQSTPLFIVEELVFHFPPKQNSKVSYFLKINK